LPDTSYEHQHKLLVHLKGNSRNNYVKLKKKRGKSHCRFWRFADRASQYDLSN